MILVDTSVRVDHGRRLEPHLLDGMREGRIAIHDYVIGELALGTMTNRTATMRLLGSGPQIPTLATRDVLDLIVREQVFGVGIGRVDTPLLASALAGLDARLWTRDRRLARVADRLGVLSELA